MTPIMNFLVNDVLPDNKEEAKKVRRHMASYTVVNEKLFRRVFSTPLLKCLERIQADYVLAENG